MPLLETRGITVSFGGLNALDDVSLAVESGQILGLIGPNGAGKTTLFNVICGFVKPVRGSIVWQGQDLTPVVPRRLASLGIARTLQGLGLFPHLTVIENVMVGANRHATANSFRAALGLAKADRDERALRRRAADVLDTLGVSEAANRLPTTLPYGLQKRVVLARALVADPQLLLLDEPASGLSEAEMRELADVVWTLRQRMSVMLVEHQMDLVMSLCDAVAVLDFGRIIARGSPDDVRTNPAVLDAYLGEAVTGGD